MISKEEIEQLATLARLEVTPTEVTSLQKDISNILGYVGQVAAVSLQGDAFTPGLSKASPLTQPYNVLRNDVPRAAGDTMAGKEAELVAAFPKHEGTFNIVRKIIQKDE
jgi:aspartyl/glutamyl-tRNA(Asn/Gln) amidotransferase C subunit